MMLRRKFVREARQAVAAACGAPVDQVYVVWSGWALRRRKAIVGVSALPGVRFEVSASHLGKGLVVDAYERKEGYFDGCDVL